MADDGTGDAVKDRFASRFESEGNQKNEQSPNDGKDSKNAKASETVNIKREWSNHSFYLPDALADTLGRRYKYLDLELDEEFGVPIQKTRHYYPLIVELGLERLDELEPKEVKDRVEELEG